MKLSSAPPSVSDLDLQTQQLSLKSELELQLLCTNTSSVDNQCTLETLVEQNSDDAAAASPSVKTKQQLQQGALAVFGSTFLTIFLSEMGDKTQVATLLMSAESHSPWVVFAGASSALVMTSLLGCLLGRWLANRVSPQMLKTAAGVSLLFISVQLFWEILH